MSEAVRVERHEDMSPMGRLCLILQPDGDVIVAIIPDPNADDWNQQSVEFCSPGSGGGRSRKILEALRALAVAMNEDNASKPIGGIEPIDSLKRIGYSYDEIRKRAEIMDCHADTCDSSDSLTPCRIGMCPQGCVFDDQRHRIAALSALGQGVVGEGETR